MKYYFQLQYKRLYRSVEETGINRYLAILVLVVLFSGLSYGLFMRSEFAPEIYSLLGLAAILQWSKEQRNVFLKTIFTPSNYRKLRWLENTLTALPFAIVLVIFKEPLLAGGVIVVGGLLSFYNRLKGISKVIPTPFGKRPFEFTAGFRRSILIIVLLYALTVVAVVIKNYNIGVFSILGIMLLCTYYYAKVEEEFFVWVHSLSPRQFMKRKMITVVMYSVILALPPIVTLLIVAPHYYVIIIGLLIWGVLLVLQNMLAKYAYFPVEAPAIAGIMMVLSLIFPPLVLVIVPMYYKKASNNLKYLLHEGSVVA